MNAKHDWAAKKAEEILGQSDVPLVAWLARDIATALRDAARVPEGCVRIGDKDIKYVGEPTMTEDGVMVLAGGKVWPLHQIDLGDGKDDVAPVKLKYAVIDPSDGAELDHGDWADIGKCFSTKEAAALAQPTPAHGENLCRSCGRHRDTHVGTQRSCFGGTGEIFTPAREEGENVTCEHDIIRTACPTCNIWASTHRPKEPAND